MTGAPRSAGCGTGSSSNGFQPSDLEQMLYRAESSYVRYYNKNKEKVLKIHKLYRENNREKRNKYNKLYYEKNKEKLKKKRMQRQQEEAKQEEAKQKEANQNAAAMDGSPQLDGVRCWRGAQHP